jgi:hypothetical protein
MYISEKNDQLLMKSDASGVGTGAVLISVADKSLKEIAVMSDNELITITGSSICSFTLKE